MDKPYLCEFLFVSFRFYLENIALMSKDKARIDVRAAFDGCGAILCF